MSVCGTLACERVTKAYILHITKHRKGTCQVSDYLHSIKLALRGMVSFANYFTTIFAIIRALIAFEGSIPIRIYLL